MRAQRPADEVGPRALSKALFTLLRAFYKRQARALCTQAASAASFYARDHRGRLESELRSVRRQRDRQQRVADKEIDLRHVMDADMPADFMIKIYHLK